MNLVLLMLYRPFWGCVELITKLAKWLTGADEDTVFSLVVVASVWLMLLSILVLEHRDAIHAGAR